MLAYLNTQMARDNYIKLLPFVSGKLNVGALRRRVIRAANVQRFSYPVLKSVCQIVVHHAVGVGYLLPLAASCKRKGAQSRAVTLDYIGNVNVEGKSAAVYERKVQIASARLAFKVFGDGDIRFLRHFLGAEPLDLAQLAYARRHLAYFVVKSRDLLHLFFPPCVDV